MTDCIAGSSHKMLDTHVKLSQGDKIVICCRQEASYRPQAPSGKEVGFAEAKLPYAHQTMHKKGIEWG